MSRSCWRWRDWLISYCWGWPWHSWSIQYCWPAQPPNLSNSYIQVIQNTWAVHFKHTPLYLGIVNYNLWRIIPACRTSEIALAGLQHNKGEEYNLNISFDFEFPLGRLNLGKKINTYDFTLYSWHFFETSFVDLIYDSYVEFKVFVEEGEGRIDWCFP